MSEQQRIKLEVYKPKEVFPAQHVYDVWLKLVRNEELYAAMMANQYVDLARSLNMSDEEIAIMEDFRIQPGTVWHMENIRYRCIIMVGRNVKWHLPATVQYLTEGNENWWRDMSWEYMAWTKWDDHGVHYRFAECLRFGEFAKTRVLKRRVPDPNIEAILDFELSVLGMLQQAAKLTADDWGAGKGRALEPTIKPKLSPAGLIATMPIECVTWLADPKGAFRLDSDSPTTIVAYVPAPGQSHKLEKLDRNAVALLAACDGKRTVADILADPAFAAARASNEALLKRWLSDRVIWA